MGKGGRNLFSIVPLLFKIIMSGSTFRNNRYAGFIPVVARLRGRRRTQLWL